MFIICCVYVYLRANVPEISSRVGSESLTSYTVGGETRGSALVMGCREVK